MIYPLQNKKTLQTTVQLLVDAVNQHYDVDRVLADFGIKILGRVNYTSQIPGYITGQYDGKFGDAYLVSQASNNTAPYDVYIWTRLTSTSVEPEGYWLDIGLLATVGPKGDKGDTGPQGPQGQNTRWYIFTTLPETGDYKPGDVALLPNGNVYMYVSQEYGWSNASQVNIKGPSGSPGRNGQTPYIGPDGTWWIGIQSTGVRAEGRDGANGIPGTAILIQGKLNSVDLLPNPATAPRNYGYLITVNDVVRLYYIAGIEGEENWQYIEYSGNGTIVTTDGVAQATWDTNTKRNRITTAYRVYETDANGKDSIGTWAQGSADGNTYVKRLPSGNVVTALTPTNDNHATSKKYVDDLAATKVTIPSANDMTSGINYVFGTLNQGQTIIPYKVTDANAAWTIPQRGAGSTLSVGTPTANEHAATKKYVDDAIAAAGGGDYETAIITKVGDVGSTCRLEMSDLPDIVPGTQVAIYISISTAGITMGPPPATFSIGNNNLAWSTTSYLGIPFFDNSSDQSCATVFNDGTNFITTKASAAGVTYGTAVTGTYMDIGISDGTGGQTTLTVTYIKHK